MRPRPSENKDAINLAMWRGGQRQIGVVGQTGVMRLFPNLVISRRPDVRNRWFDQRMWLLLLAFLNICHPLPSPCPALPCSSRPPRAQSPLRRPSTFGCCALCSHINMVGLVFNTQDFLPSNGKLATFPPASLTTPYFVFFL